MDKARLDELLKGVPLGPWFANVNDLIGGWCVGTISKYASEGRGSDDVADFLTAPNAKLVSAVPDIVEALREAWAQLESLTPGGSEFVGNPSRCAEWAKDRIDNTQQLLIEAKVEIKRLRAQLGDWGEELADRDVT